MTSANGPLSREIRNLRQRYQQRRKAERVKGRQMFKMVIDDYAISETEGHMFDIRDLLALSMANADLEYFNRSRLFDLSSTLSDIDTY